MATTQNRPGSAAGGNGHAAASAVAPLTRFNVEEITALLAYEACWAENTPAASSHLTQFRREDGTYSCAVKDCEGCGHPNRKSDTLAVFGPFVLCRKHAHEALRFGRDRLGIADESWNYTLLYSAIGHTAAYEAVSDRKAKRMDEARAEMASRSERLVEALVEARLRMREREEAEIAARRAAHERTPTPAEPMISEDNIPTVEFYRELSDEDLEAAYQVASDLTELIQQELDRERISREEADQQLAEQRRAVERMKEARHGKAMSAIEALKAKMGFRVPTAATEPSAARKPDPFGRNPLPTGPRPVAQVIGHIEPHRSAAPAERGALMAACNVASALIGNPHEGLDAIPVFSVKELRDAPACEQALGLVGGTWFRLLQDHAPDAKAKDLRDKPRVKKQAADKAKACLLHGPLARAVAMYRNRVIQYFQAKFPKGWDEYLARITAGKAKEAAPSAKPCEICGGPGGSQEWKGQQVCTACKNRATLAKRLSNASKRAGDDHQRWEDTKGPSGGGGGRGNKGGGKDKGGKKGRR